MENRIIKNSIIIPRIIFGPDELGYTPRPKVTRLLFMKIFKKIKRKTWDSYRYVLQIENALNIGFNSVDFSAAYGDGSLISKAIKKSRLQREQVFLITRISNKAQFLSGGAIESEIRKQLNGFGTDYVDMLMFHWPVTNHYEETWKTMIELRSKGYCKYLGVANCHEHHIEKLYECSGEYPIVNQIELHPLFTQVPLRSYCNDHGIQVMAYSPTARHDDRLYNPPLLKKLAEKYDKSPTQLILRWHIQNGIIPVIRTLNYEHQKEDVKIFDFSISESDMKLIDNLNINSRIRYDPDNCDFHCL